MPSAFVFKTSIEPHLGEISIFKVYGGEITEAMDMINATKSSKERLSQIFAIAGKTRQKLDKVVAGDIVATIKLKGTSTNDTLNSIKNPDDVIEKIKFPEPKIKLAVKARNTADEEKLSAVLE